MTGSRPQPDRKRDTTDMDTLLFDPRRGDAEVDASSPKLRSLLAIAGSLLLECRLPKLVFARTVSILLLAVLLGSAPLDAASNGPTWRTAHLSGIHIVGERYGVRIESGRSGLDGNDRIAKIMAGIEAIHSVRPLHLVLVGDRNR